MRNTPPAPPYVAILLISAAALAYEVLLTRLFSIVQWHHFAYLVISVALLGYGASGSLVALLRERLVQHFAPVFTGAAMVFGVSAVTCFLLAQRVPFNALEVMWDARQWAYLGLMYLLLLWPFLFAASCVCLSFTAFPTLAHRIYSFDIGGAALGCIAVVAALSVFHPLQVLVGIAGCSTLAALAAALWSRATFRWVLLVPFGSAGMVAVAAYGLGLDLKPSPYKELSQTLRVFGTRVVAERSNALGLLTVVESLQVPFRHAPGLSLNATDEPPAQLGIFTDGEGLSALTHLGGGIRALAYLGYLTSAAPYHLLHAPRVLVLGAGAGSDVLQALYHRAASIDAVELNPALVRLVSEDFAQYSGNPYGIEGVRLHIAEARGFVASTAQSFDTIQLALLDAFGASSAGLYALAETYLYTVEAFREYLKLLNPEGILSITRWVSLPPRDILKLFATAAIAMEREGMQPRASLALIRGWKTTTLLAKKGAYTTEQLEALRRFCRERSFDLEYYPGITREEANRYNVLRRADFFDAAQAILSGERWRFIGRYKFDISPATDDRPYFFQSFRWRSLPELWAMREQGGLSLMEWGYPVLVVTLLQAVPISMLLIAAPLLASRKIRHAAQTPFAWRGAAYFAAIGFAFMFVEIAFIQKFLLFLTHPLYAVAVVLAAFLFFAGAGARLSESATTDTPRRIRRVAMVIGILALGYVLVLPNIFRALMFLPGIAKIAISVALIAPLAVLMGMPFPSGLMMIEERLPPLIPWAWAVNGCASVVGAVLATLLAIHFGFTALVACAAALYLLAATVLAWPIPRPLRGR